MKKSCMLAVVFIGLFVSAQGARAESAHRLGVGVNYWTMMADIDIDNFDKDGFSWLVTYQYRPAALIKIEADVEFFPRGFQGIDSTAFAPEAYVVVGSWIYGAIGTGILYADGDFANDLFYALRAGLDLEVVPQFYMDLNLNYRFADGTSLSEAAEDINANTLTVGAALRFEF